MSPDVFPDSAGHQQLHLCTILDPPPLCPYPTALSLSHRQTLHTIKQISHTSSSCVAGRVTKPSVVSRVCFVAMQAHPHRSRRRRGPKRRIKITEIKTPAFCPYCPHRIFKHVDAVREHFRRLHKKTDCRICHIDFGHAHALIDHAQLHYRTESPAEDVVSSVYAPSVNSQASQPSQANQPGQPGQSGQPIIPAAFNPIHPAGTSRTGPCLAGIVDPVPFASSPPSSELHHARLSSSSCAKHKPFRDMCCQKCIAKGK